MPTTGAMPNSFDPARAAPSTRGCGTWSCAAAVCWGPATSCIYARPLAVRPRRGRAPVRRRRRRLPRRLQQRASRRPLPPARRRGDRPPGADAQHAHPLPRTSRSSTTPSGCWPRYPADLGHVMFTCTGSEANDLALRIARFAHRRRRASSSPRNAYHGVTTAAVAEIVAVARADRAARRARAHRRARPAATSRRRARSAPLAGARRDGDRGPAPRTASAPAALIADTVFSSDGILPDPPGFLRPVVDVVRAAGGAVHRRRGAGRLRPHRRRDVGLPAPRHRARPRHHGQADGQRPCRSPASRRAPSCSSAFGHEVRYFNTFGGNSVAIAAAAWRCST